MSRSYSRLTALRESCEEEYIQSSQIYQYVIVPVIICQIPFIASIWLAPQCTKNGSASAQPHSHSLISPRLRE
jgi:hypothetical protein